MSFFRNLSVGAKLGASAGLAVLLMVMLVALVTRQVQVVQQEQAQDRQAAAAQDAAFAASRAVLEAQAAWRGVLLSNRPEPLAEETALLARMLAAASHSIGEAGRLAVAAEARRQVDAALASMTGLRSAYEAGAAQRAELVQRRDRDFFPRFAEFDQALEAATSNLNFGMDADAREAARDVLSTYATAINDVRMGIQRYLATDAADAAGRVRRASSQSRVHARRIVAAVTPELQADMRRLTETGEALAAEAERLLALAVQLQETRQASSRSHMAALGEIAAAAAALSAAAQTSAGRVGEAVTSVESAVWGVGALVAVLLAVTGWLNSRAIGVPLGRLATAVTRIAGGDTAAAVPDTARRDEIGRIAGALEGLRHGVATAFARQQMLDQMNVGVVMASRDLTITYANPEMTRLRPEFAPLEGTTLDASLAPELRALADPSCLPHSARLTLDDRVFDLQASAIHDRDGRHVGPMLLWRDVTAQARLANGFEDEIGQVIEALASAATRLQGQAESVAAAAEVSGREASAVAQASGQAGHDVQAVAASAEQLAASVAEITRQVAEGAGVARAAAEEARGTDGTVQGLSAAASRIGDVVRLISDIAAQTSLLALNATIEAARAGDAGKGFAVVASEVKNLAAQTAKATEDIALQVGGIQASTGAAVGALASITATVERMNEVTAAIAAAVEQQGAATREIARSAALVAEGTLTVTRRIGEVREAASQTGDAAGAMLEGSGTLSSEAGQLRMKSAGFLSRLRAA